MHIPCNECIVFEVYSAVFSMAIYDYFGGWDIYLRRIWQAIATETACLVCRPVTKYTQHAHSAFKVINKRQLFITISMKLAVAVACCLLALMVAGKRVVNQVPVASCCCQLLAAISKWQQQQQSLSSNSEQQRVAHSLQLIKLKSA